MLVTTRLSRPWGAISTRWLLLAAVSLLLVGCGGRGRPLNPFDRSEPTGGIVESIRIEVQNLHFNDATVYALRASQRVRVGRVTGKTDRRFRINWNVAAPIAFEVDIVGSRSCRTGSVAVEANSVVWLSIPSDMGFGTCHIGRR